MKKLLAILMVMCMLISLVACTSAPAETKAPETQAPAVQEDPKPTEAKDPDPVTIRFLQAGGDTVDASTVMRALLDVFEAKYPWIPSPPG